VLLIGLALHDMALGSDNLKRGEVEYEKITYYCWLRMFEVSTKQLKQAVESQHGGTATLLRLVPVRETFQGNKVWDGMVHVFKLEGHPKATRVFAWSYERPDGKRRFFAVLDIPPIMSPVDAVRAAIVAEARAGK